MSFLHLPLHLNTGTANWLPSQSLILPCHTSRRLNLYLRCMSAVVFARFLSSFKASFIPAALGFLGCAFLALL